MKKKINAAKFNEDEQTLIALLHDSGASWDEKVVIENDDYTEERNQIKEFLKAWLVDEQSNDCAYCLLPMFGGVDLEHFAKQSKYPRLTFNPLNIVAACTVCNRRRKFAKNVVLNDRGSNETWDFSIVHPILQNPSDHLTFDHEWVLIEAIITPEGEETVRMFDLLEPEMVLEREKCAAHRNQRLSRQDQILLEEIMSRPRNRFGKITDG